MLEGRGASDGVAAPSPLCREDNWRRHVLNLCVFVCPRLRRSARLAPASPPRCVRKRGSRR
eukprot:3841343-Alexandrium_andersonii.AAC.1